jgi:hypothetical protein
MVASFGLIARFFGLSSLPWRRKAVSLAQNNHKIASKIRKTDLVSTASRGCWHKTRFCDFLGKTFDVFCALAAFAGAKPARAAGLGILARIFSHTIAVPSQNPDVHRATAVFGALFPSFGL